MELMEQNKLKEFIHNIAMIVVFIAIKASPLGNYIEGFWFWAILIGIMIFTYAHTIGAFIHNLINFISEKLWTKFFSNVGIIIIFIALSRSPVKQYIDMYWLYWMIGGIIIFAGASYIAKKISK